MSYEENDKELERTNNLFRFLQGIMPDGYSVRKRTVPKLSAEQAWTVIWYLQNQYWQPDDAIKRCDICGDLYHSWQEGRCLDYGKAPCFFCDNCINTDVFKKKERSKLNPGRARRLVKIL